MHPAHRIARITSALVLVPLAEACSKPASSKPSALALASISASASASDDYSARVQTGLQLNRTGQWGEARELAETYLASTQGSSSSQERCAMLVMAAYSNALLRENARGETELRTFTSECAQYALPFGWHMEAGRVRRLLDGEHPSAVYPTVARGDRSRS